ncbi:MAG: type II toxin-antitoxin system Phd/YefM family antitoxin [Nitrosomonas sp.]|uniref:type II toxin-antitoxin system Phd/YefM family antitoxin n=1 Tax=Nitrosomonas sp. TaxID=42353 RepID=UPI001D726093|nr:type II toxin-antitoxin system Phd/YefM family antitoxin [Nitrosomonas sp.]MBX9895074.1 type II toxin-antitoxin system Phd/YefM family antitoxin [Nitrosomonas sp.]
MDNISVNKFRDNLKNIVEKVISEHQPVKITRRNGEDFVVISAQDWAREQETLFVLQNSPLMQQILASTQTHAAKSGYTPSDEKTQKILGV